MNRNIDDQIVWKRGKAERKKKRIVLITYSFPYGQTFETFLETEVKYWRGQEVFELIILPMVIDAHKRKIYDNIFVDNSLANFLSPKAQKISQKIYKFLYIFKSIHRSIFWKELFFRGS